MMLFELKVTGESTESQLMSSLSFYKSRHVYVQKSLYHMFSLTKNMPNTRIDLLELILELMRIHSKSQSVQLAATTCIFNLTQQNCYAQIPADLLTQIVNSVLINMQSFPNNVVIVQLARIFNLFYFKQISLRKAQNELLVYFVKSKYAG